jgi:hypothetical protein
MAISTITTEFKMTGTQSDFIANLAKVNNVKLVSTTQYGYRLIFKDGKIFDGLFYDCLKKLGHYGYVN